MYYRTHLNIWPLACQQPLAQQQASAAQHGIGAAGSVLVQHLPLRVEQVHRFGRQVAAQFFQPRCQRSRPGTGAAAPLCRLLLQLLAQQRLTGLPIQGLGH